MNAKPSSLLADTSLTFLQKVLGALCKLGFVVLVARYLGVKASGDVAIALLLPLAFTRVFGFGLHLSNAYQISHDKILTQYCVVFSLATIIFSSIFALLSFGILVSFDWKLFSDVNIDLLYLSILFYPFEMCTIFIHSIFRGRYEIRTLNSLLLLPPLARLILCLGLILIDEFTTRNAVLAWGLSFVITCAVGGFSVARICHKEWTEFRIRFDEFSAWLKYGIKYYLDSVFYFLTLRSDLFLVNYFLGGASAGIYSIVLQLCDRILLLPNSLSTVLLPRLGKLKRSEEETQRYMLALASATLYIAAGLVVALLLFAEPIIILLFGREFLPAAEVLWFLLPGIVAYSMSHTLSVFLASIGRPELNSIREGIAFIVNLLLNLLLIPYLGIVGAALATSVAYLLSFLLAMHFYAKAVGTYPLLAIIFNRDLVALSLKNLRRYGRRISSRLGETRPSSLREAKE